MENINLKNIIEETIRKEVKRAILENTNSNEVYIIKNKKGEPIEVCQTQEEAEEKKAGYESKHPEQELIIEPGEEPTFDELDAMSEKLDNMENIEETSKKHKGSFTVDQVEKLAKKASKTNPEAGEALEKLAHKHYHSEEMYGPHVPANDVFDILNGHEMSELKSKIKIKESEAFTAPKLEVDELHGNQDKLDVDHDGEIEASDLSALRAGEQAEEEECDECGGGMSSMEEENNVCEKCGKEMCECGSGGMYESKKSVRLTEAELVKLISGMVNEAVPGLTAFQSAHKLSGTQNNAALSDVEKKIKDYLGFDGNDNPEFPGHNEGDVEARQSTGDEADEIADNRGGGLEDLDYDVEPSDKFKERLEMSLKGDAKMGNGQKDAGNVIPSDLGEKMIKKVKRKEEAKKEAPMYVKDPAPIKNVNESVVISEEVKRMKEMFTYNKKTQ